MALPDDRTVTGRERTSEIRPKCTRATDNAESGCSRSSQTRYLASDLGSYYKRNTGEIVEAFPNFEVLPREFSGKGKQTAAQKAGLRYERKATQDFETRFKTFLAQLSIVFHTSSSRSSIVLDGVIFSPETGVLALIEYKLRHDSTGWYQLNYYARVARAAFAGWRIKKLEVVKNYYPDAWIGEPFDVIQLHQIEDWIRDGQKDFGVCIY